jgi:hypothetical protein
VPIISHKPYPLELIHVTQATGPNNNLCDVAHTFSRSDVDTWTVKIGIMAADVKRIRLLLMVKKGEVVL